MQVPCTSASSSSSCGAATAMLLLHATALLAAVAGRAGAGAGVPLVEPDGWGQPGASHGMSITGMSRKDTGAEAKVA